jgi:hypothetical protein
MRRCAADHPPGLVTDCLHPAGALVNRHHRWLEEHHALAAAKHHRVRRS